VRYRPSCAAVGSDGRWSPAPAIRPVGARARTAPRPCRRCPAVRAVPARQTPTAGGLAVAVAAVAGLVVARRPRRRGERIPRVVAARGFRTRRGGVQRRPGADRHDSRLLGDSRRRSGDRRDHLRPAALPPAGGRDALAASVRQALFSVVTSGTCPRHLTDEESWTDYWSMLIPLGPAHLSSVRHSVRETGVRCLR